MEQNMEQKKKRKSSGRRNARTAEQIFGQAFIEELKQSLLRAMIDTGLPLGDLVGKIGISVLTLQGLMNGKHKLMPRTALKLYTWLKTFNGSKDVHFVVRNEPKQDLS
jgi:hypothetical protein